MAAKLARRSFLAGLAAAPALSRAAPVRAQTTRPLAGLFTGGALSNNPAPIAQRVQQYDQWLTNGTRQTPLFIDFAAHDTWANALGSLALVPAWSPMCPPATLALAWPLVTQQKAGAAGFAEIVAGGQDATLARLCQVLVSRNMANAIIRLGWEMNGDWYPWNAALDRAGYVAAFRRVVTYCRAQAGVRFRWCWNPNIGKQQIAWTDCYPGNEYVDLIGIDIYDMYWGDPSTVAQADRWKIANEGPFGLKEIAAFARQAGKPLVVPEWGVGRAGPIGGGTENPAWIDFMADFILNPVNNVAWHAYWNRDAGSGYEGQIYPTNLRPQTAARYKARFGT